MNIEDDVNNNPDQVLDEVELEPPQENKAKKLNVNNIIKILLLSVVAIIVIVVIFSKISIGKKKEKESSELDKAGSKYIPDIELKDNSSIVSDINSSNDNSVTNKDNIDNVINSLPPDFQQPTPSTAPIVTTQSVSTYKSDRPDTRNSNSIRKIEGIAGQELSNASTNQNIISNVMSWSGNYNNKAISSGQTNQNKDEYIASLLSQAQNPKYGNGSQNQTSYQANKETFYNNTSNVSGQGQWLSYASLWDGSIITGALVTAINTDNPGVVIARVTENVFSSYDSSFLLIPEGTLLYATYNSSVSYGQNRVQIAWNLLIRPDGYRMELGNMNGVDSTGQSGTKGFATSHPFETLKALGLVAVFSIIQTEITNDIKTSTNEYAQNAMNDVYSEASKLGNKIVDRALDIKPQITIKQGTQIKFITNQPLNLPPVQINQVTRKYTRSN